jgi:O-antigen/teichoic acid export membrane protein
VVPACASATEPRQTSPSTRLEPDTPLTPGRKGAAARANGVTGRDGLASSVLASWAGYSVFVVIGFLLPRFIDQQIGQTALGVWDFSWSLVSYFGISQLGIGASVNRYVAKYRAEGNTDGLNRSVSSTMCVQILAATLVLLLTTVAAILVPSLLGGRLGDFRQEAPWVLMALGLGLAIQMACASFVGVMTGCHRWDLHNAVNAGCHGATAALMMVALALGGGLRSLAIANLCGVIVTEAIRVVAARSICPELRVHPRYVSAPQIRVMLTFGGKVVLASVSSLLLYQTTSMLVATHVGVASLALFSRPLGLVRHISTLVDKLGSVLTPTVSSMQAMRQGEAVRELVTTAGRYSAHVALPAVVFCALLGGPLLGVWMGARYERGELLALLAVGHLVSIVQQPAINILAGLNRHGPSALAQVSASAVAVGLCIVALRWADLGLAGAAVAIGLPLTIVHGLCVPIYVCRQVNLTLGRYLLSIWTRPLVCVIPFTVCLIVLRLLLPGHALGLVISGVCLGGLVLCVTYWTWAIPRALREQVKGRVRALRKRSRVAPRSGSTAAKP